MTLPRKKSISGSSAFLRAKKYGKTYSSPFLLLSVLKSDDPVRFGIVISKKVSGKAVERHRIKRIISNLILESEDRLKAGFWYIFIARPPVEGKSYEEISTSFNQVLSAIPLS